jgi:DMSO/TMAO reductase YedYZ molybdopterin-dependent catalytic subunit
MAKMPEFKFTRRQIIRSASLAAPVMGLSGCDILDDLNERDAPARNFVESANSLTYRVQRMIGGGHSMAPEFTQADIRQSQHPNGITSPDDEDYKTLASAGFSSYLLKVTGAVEKPLKISREALMAMPSRTQITRHDCVEGWSCIAKWTGVPLGTILDEAKPKLDARFVVFHCFDTIERSLSGSVKYYESIDMIDAYHPQTILAYGLNDKPLPVENGAPLRVRIERQLGYKMAKYVHTIEMVSSFADIEGGKGGYWEDNGYDWYAGI